MKREVSPVMAVVVIVVVLLIIGGIYVLATGKRPFGKAEQPPGIPPEVQQEFQRRLGGMTPQGTTAPTPR